MVVTISVVPALGHDVTLQGIVRSTALAAEEPNTSCIYEEGWGEDQRQLRLIQVVMAEHFGHPSINVLAPQPSWCDSGDYYTHKLNTRPQRGFLANDPTLKKIKQLNFVNQFYELLEVSNLYFSTRIWKKKIIVIACAGNTKWKYHLTHGKENYLFYLIRQDLRTIFLQVSLKKVVRCSLLLFVFP